MEAHPTEHPLQPHQIALLALFLFTFKELPTKKLHPKFLLHLQRMLLDEVSEVAPPKSAVALQEKVSALPESDEGDAVTLIYAFKTFKLDTIDYLINFFSGIPFLYQEKDDGPDPILGRRSIFGFYCRRCYISFGKLSFSGVTQLHRNFKLWWNAQPNSGYKTVLKDELNHADHQLFKTQGDRTNWAQPDDYESWLRSQKTGDETMAKENLRSFFEQRFHDGNDSGIRQLGLLNMVRHHYVHGEFSAGRKLLSEAISVSRTSGDKITLQQCISLLRRFPPVDGVQKPPINEIQPNLNPLDILYDVKKLMDESNEQPLNASFVKIAQAVGVYDSWVDTKKTTIREADQWAQHAIQAIAWSAAGCEDLADIERNIVIAFTKAGSDDNNRLTTILNLAYRRARQGNYDNALAMLVDPLVWRGLTLADYKMWAHEVWLILALRAARRGQDRLYREFLLPRRPPINNALEGHSPSTISKMSDSLYQVILMRKVDQAGTAMEPLLKVLWHSEFLFRIHPYRTAIVLLADIGLEYGLSKRSRKMIEDILPQIIDGRDLELRATATFTLARCIIAAEQSSTSALQEAAECLAKAEKDYMALQMYQSAMDVQYLLAVVFNTMGSEQQRDAAAQRHSVTQQLQRDLAMVVVDEEAELILDLVSRVGLLDS